MLVDTKFYGTRYLTCVHCWPGVRGGGGDRHRNSLGLGSMRLITEYEVVIIKDA